RLVAAAVAPPAASALVVRVLGVQCVAALRALTENRKARIARRRRNSCRRHCSVRYRRVV
ncbi:MAG: hypothetical protein ACO32O_08520, partial [Ilumatobacteraceae bacterium]